MGARHIEFLTNLIFCIVVFLYLLSITRFQYKFGSLAVFVEHGVEAIAEPYPLFILYVEQYFEALNELFNRFLHAVVFTGLV